MFLAACAGGQQNGVGSGSNAGNFTAAEAIARSSALIRQSRYAEAAELTDRAVELATIQLGEFHIVTMQYRMLLGSAEMLRGNVKLSEQLLERAVKELRGAGPANRAPLAQALQWLAENKLRQRQISLALTLAEEAKDVQEAVLGANHPNVGRVWGTLGRIRLAEKNFEAAEINLKKALEILSNAGFGESNKGFRGLRRSLISTQTKLGRFK